MTGRSYGAGVLALLSVTLLGSAGPGPAAQQTGLVGGRIEIGVPVPSRRSTSAYSRTITTPGLATTSELRNVVVYVKGAPSRPVTVTRATIKQREETFEPRVLALPVGSQVDFPNDDPIYHNVFSLSHVKSFDLGRYPRGTSRGVRFDKPGVVRIFCQLHSHMTATVLVFDHPWFAIPNDEGRYELPALPAGNFEITAWHERLGDTTTHVRVEPGGASAADFVLPIPRQ
jgi:plastocyanin